MDEPAVPSDVIRQISGAMEYQKKTASRQLTEDATIQSRAELRQALKTARIQGDAIVEWTDDQGTLHANVIDFLSLAKMKAIDPATGQSIMVETKLLGDGSWRVLF
jgi:hypothetical protein